MTARRARALAVVACALGGVLVLVSGGRIWAHGTGGGSGSAVALSVTGDEVSRGIPAIGIALIALAAAIIASSGVMRRLVGLAVVLVAGAAIGAAIIAHAHASNALRNQESANSPIHGLAVQHVTANGWWLVTLLGGLLALLAGVLTVFGSQRWAGMGAKYEAPSAPAPTKDPATVAWDALDRGEDPTT